MAHYLIKLFLSAAIIATVSEVALAATAAAATRSRPREASPGPTPQARPMTPVT